MDWLRWWHGTVTDPKFQRVARMSGASVAEVLAVWACLLECASAVPESGDGVTACDADVTPCDVTVTHVTRGDVTNFDCDDHDVLLGFCDGKTALVVAALNERGLITGGRLASWDERQPALRDSTGKRQSSSAARTKAYRARKKAAENVTPCDANSDVTPVTGDKSDAGDAPEKTRQDKSKSNNPLSPPAGEKSAAKPAAKQANAATSRSKPKRLIPEPFLTTTEMLDWAAERVPLVNLDLETERFINHFKAEGKAKADWPATWRNWMLRAQGDADRYGYRPGGAVNRQQQIEDANNAVVREIERQEREGMNAPHGFSDVVGTGEPVIEGDFIRES